MLGGRNLALVLSGPDIEPVFGQGERLVEGAEVVIGGSRAITACGAARLGLRTAMVGVVGADVFGRFMVQALAKYGVESHGIADDPNAATGPTVMLSRQVDRAILSGQRLDTIGAGDSFDAGFLTALLDGWRTRSALALGRVCGSVSTRAVGGTEAQPTLDEVHEGRAELLETR